MGLDSDAIVEARVRHSEACQRAHRAHLALLAADQALAQSEAFIAFRGAEAEMKEASLAADEALAALDEISAD